MLFRSYAVQQFIICSKLKGYIEIYEFYQNYYSCRINIIIYCLYLIGWLYVIYHNLYLIQQVNPEIVLSCVMLITKESLMKTQVKLNSNYTIIRTIKRNMLSRSFFEVGTKVTSTTKVLTPSITKVIKRNEANFSGNQPDYNNPDPQASQNNPAGGPQNQKHAEIHRDTCPQQDCNEKNCGPSVPCGPIVETKAVGHFTSGTPNIPASEGKIVPLDQTTNIVGQNKTQNVKFYKTPHNTPNTPEAFPSPGQPHGKGTNYIHDPANPHRMIAIIQETKDK